MADYDPASFRYQSRAVQAWRVVRHVPLGVLRAVVRTCWWAIRGCPREPDCSKRYWLLCIWKAESIRTRIRMGAFAVPRVIQLRGRRG